MTDCGHRLAAAHEITDELHRFLIRAELVGIGDPAREDQRIEIGSGYVGDQSIRRDRIGLLVLDRALDRIEG
jgi:hypothetical protein